ncbi:hypothetical protein [Bacillus inaquosorum]
MVAHKVKKKNRPREYHGYYACGNYTNKGIKTCKTNLVKTGYAEEYILKEIGKLVDNPKIVNSIVKKLKKATEVDTWEISKLKKNRT